MLPQDNHVAIKADMVKRMNPDASSSSDADTDLTSKSRVLAGPVATRFLAGLGADVLRIDPPDWEEPAVIPEVSLGKRCARLDLRASRPVKPASVNSASDPRLRLPARWRRGGTSAPP